ncbi:hypothetical protein M422DRAFT_187908 [Sphaerobolus stellatus SS14]|uniref:Uncharacterized protein n=1 Tax=Sphaerobolus stellatus (strain SS14) TaxID=990650 RepID=A0A0C9TJM7_SPHS4|nr:hypothetical protein M422DRAFT_187908 [Sphaerobolus stellatus SS14]
MAPQEEPLPSRRIRRRPRHHNDIFPEPPEPAPSWISRIKRVVLHVPELLPEGIETAPNIFRLFRRYLANPSYDPDTPTAPEPSESGASANLTELDPEVEILVSPNGSSGIGKFYPFTNFSQFSFAKLWNGNKTGQLSDVFFNDTIKTISDPNFSIQDLRGWSARKMKQQLESMDKQDTRSELDPNLPEVLHSSDGWRRNVKVSISIPEGKKFWTTPQGHKFEISGLHYRSITAIVKNVYSSARNIHFSPFELFYRKSDAPDDVEQVYGELYSSPAYIEAQRKLEHLPKIAYERIIAPLMFWSDSTHLTSFGSAKLWPIYMLFGSQSKLLRGRPSAHLCHHLAYIPSLPDTVQDVIREITSGTAGSPALLAHCKRELMHAIWKILLDDEFRDAYKNGILIKCADGITRLVYLRIFTYSADYPEKVLLATIRDLGLCPCPRCDIEKKQVDLMGMDRDMARRRNPNHIRKDDHARRYDVEKARALIDVKGVPVTGKGVENILKPHSRVPTVNAFSERLLDLGFEFHLMFVVDFLHEIELGTWKATLMHLIRLLYAQATSTVHELNQRIILKHTHRQIPTFGGDTIRNFSDNVADLKRMAARDYEDILQCSLPAFEGLLEEPYNTMLCDLLFTFAYWHGVAKLRMHTDSTIALLEQLTKQFGTMIRKFRDVTASRYITLELPREKDARVRRLAAAASQGQQRAPGDSTMKTKRKGLNLNTYKFHAMGDYPYTIRYFGSIESYSTGRGELEHRRTKQRYARVWKKDTTLSLTRIERRDNNMRLIEANVRVASNTFQDHNEPEPLPEMDPREHWSISFSEKRNRIDIGTFLLNNRGDPAIKEHLLARILGCNSTDDEVNFSHQERMRVLIVDDCMFEHARLCVNYTSYDLRRCQDSLSPKGHHRDIMVDAQDDPDSPIFHPYWYARIIGIYHVKVIYMRPNGVMEPVRKMHFLWVRWFGRDSSFNSGPKFRRLHRIGFVHDEDDTESFGFLDPTCVIRAVHLIPAFNEGRTTELLGNSIARHYDNSEDDWQFLYVNMFVDRDMLMRYMGGGIGHSIRYHTDNSMDLSDIVPSGAEAPGENASEILCLQPQTVPEGEENIPEPMETDFELDDEDKDSFDEDEDELGLDEEELFDEEELDDPEYDSP